MAISLFLLKKKSEIIGTFSSIAFQFFLYVYGDYLCQMINKAEF